MAFVKIYDKEVRTLLDEAIRTVPKEVAEAVRKTAIDGARYARQQTPRVTGQARRSWRTRILRERGVKAKNIFRRIVSSRDVAVYTLSNGRKPGLSRPYKKYGRIQKPQKVREMTGNSYVYNNVYPYIQNLLDKNINEAIRKVIK